jgi:LysM domain-containing protein
MTVSSSARALAALTVLLVPGVVAAQTARPDSLTVRPGDTLWDLAHTYLGDPFLWPEIYRLNTNVVEDPHWIYPGEVLHLTGGTEVAAVPTEETPAPAIPAAGAMDTTAAAPTEAADTSAQPAEEAAPGLAEAQVGELEEPTAPGDSADLSVLFGKQQKVDETGLQGGISRLYKPIRQDEFYSSGFLSEEQKLPYGRLLGSVTPEQIATTTPHKVARIYSEIGVLPPEGAKYQVGDTLLIVRIDRIIDTWGEVVIPTGLARVTDVSRKTDIAVVVQQYAEILNDQLLLPAEKFNDPGNIRSVPISDGVQGTVIQSRDRQPLKGPLDVLFIDRGRKNGVAIGDIFEVRATPRLVEGMNIQVETLDEVMALVQVVHVSELTSTVRVAKVIEPNIRPGAGVHQIAKLPS